MAGLYLVILALSGFVTSFGAHIVATNLPWYAETVGAGTLMIGLLIGVYDFAELFAKPVAGLAADRRGMKRALLIGLAVFIAGSLLYLAIPPRLLLLVRFIQGLGAAALSTVSIALVAKYFPKGRGKAFGVYNGIKGTGYVVAPPLGGFLASRYDFSMILVVSAAVGVITLLASLWLPSDRAARVGPAGDDDDLTFAKFLGIFRESRLLPAYSVILINMFLVSVLFGFLPVYLHAIGYAPLESGLVLSLATLSYLAVQPVAGYLADAGSIMITLRVGLGLAALAIIVTTFTSGVVLIGAVVTAGIGMGTVLTNSDALVSTLVEERRLGAGMGAAQSFKELGDMVGPVLVGFVAQFYGVQVGFVTCGLLALGGLAFLGRSGPISRRGTSTRVSPRQRAS